MTGKATEKPKRKFEGFGELYADKVLSLGRENLVKRELCGYSCFGEMRLEEWMFGWKIHTKRRFFETDTELEARYLMIFLELGWREIYVPKDLSKLAEIMPRLEFLKARLDRILNEGLKKVFGRKTRWEARTLTYKKVSLIPDDSPKFEDEDLADYDEELEEEFEEEYV